MADDTEKPPPDLSLPHKETIEELNKLLATLPTTLPSTPGKLWNNNGVLSIS